MSSDAYRRLLERLESVRTLGVELGLGRVRAALAALGHPERAFHAVQVAGTNGKGSTAAMTEAILRAHGLRTGLFTSPHLCRFTERVRIDGREIDGATLASFDDAIAACGVPLTYFEVSALLAARAFAAAGVEVAVLETGLGGRLDAATAFPVVATAITSIGFDHMDLLGPTIEDIAREKAGVARAGVPLFMGDLPASAAEVVRQTAAASSAPVIEVSGQGAHGTPGLAGAHQERNAALATELARAALSARGLAFDASAAARGLASVTWPGRLEWVAEDVLLDCAHNEEGARALAAALPEMVRRAGRPLAALLTSIVRGKDAAAVLGHLAPVAPLVVCTRSPNPRSLGSDELTQVAARFVTGTLVQKDDVASALAHARAQARASGGFVLVAGSVFLVGAVRCSLLGEPVDPLVGGDPLP